MSEVMQGPVADLPVQVGVGSGWSDGWYLAAPFVDGLTHLCLGALGGIRGHVKTNGDGSYTAFHGDLQLGTVKDLDKAKAAVESGKRIRQRGDGRKAKAAKAAKGAGNGQQAMGTEQVQVVAQADTGANESTATLSSAGFVPVQLPLVPGAVAGPGTEAVGLPLPLPLPVVPLPAAVGAGTPVAVTYTGPDTVPAGGVISFEFIGATSSMPPFPPQPPDLGAVPGTVMYPVPTTVDRGMQEFLDASRAQPLPALPTEAAAPKPKADDIMTLDTLRGFMPPDWCDRLEAVAVEGFQLKDAELAYKVGYRGSNHRDVPKYYDGPPTVGVEPTVTDLLKQVGLDKVRVPGGLIMLVPGTSAATLNREKLLRAGVTVEVLEACTDPGTPYTSVTFKRDRR